MMINKSIMNNRVELLTRNFVVNCTKQAMANIVMPSLEEQGLMAYVFPGMVITKEQPTGCNYGATANPIIRVLGGRLLKNGMADAYAWNAATYAKKAAKTHPIGFGFGATVESVNWAMTILQTVSDPIEHDMLVKFFIEQPSLRLIFSPEEKRRCVEVTRELFELGLTQCVDEWMQTDESGCAQATQLRIGDFLIVTDKGYYCIRRDEFLETHTLDKQ